MNIDVTSLLNHLHLFDNAHLACSLIDLSMSSNALTRTVTAELLFKCNINFKIAAGVPSKKGIQEKEAKVKVPLELVKEDKEDVVSQTAEKQKPTDVHAEKTHKKTIVGMKAPLESYKPESWILEASKQGIKQILHLAIVSALIPRKVSDTFSSFFSNM